MDEYSIRQKCRISTNIDDDTFVGVYCDNGKFSVNFPMGYHLSDSDKDLRKDILLLLSTLSLSSKNRESELHGQSSDSSNMGFPLNSYLHIIYDYYARGYYKELEMNYTVSKRGKIDWNRTIKTQKPYIQNNKAFYLNYVIKKSQFKDNELITLIHEFFVYDAFEKIGWLFTGYMPKKPSIKYNEKLFIAVLKNKRNHTFNDDNKALFDCMLDIIKYLGDTDSNMFYKYGTYRFEYVWEYLIDRTFGVLQKSMYYPNTIWKIGTTNYSVTDTYDNSSLRPDTIMIFDGNVFVIDAKYYKYGLYGNHSLLPKSTDINKQITYGEYIAEQEAFKKMHGPNFKVYNAFIMPFDSLSDLWSSSEPIIRIGEATGSWKTGVKEYEKVQGILLDVKYLMNISTKEDVSEIDRLSNLIMEYASV